MISSAISASSAVNPFGFFTMSRRIVLALVIAAAISAHAQRADAGYEKWKSDLVEDRRQNWLTLAGLFWLKPGQNTFGSDAGNTVVLPKTARPWAGELTLWNDKITMKLSPGVHAAIAGKPVTVPTVLQSDATGHPTVVELGSLRFYVIVRGTRTGIRVKDLESPAVQKYTGPVFYPINPAYRVTAKFIPAVQKRTVAVPNVIGDIEETPVTGEVEFRLEGQELRLTDLGGEPAKGLFLVFSDLTNKTETYHAGRFLDTGPVVHGAVVLDFNRAYNPPCSLTRFATCPLPPKENRLAVAIPAGEKFERLHPRARPRPRH